MEEKETVTTSEGLEETRSLRVTHLVSLITSVFHLPSREFPLPKIEYQLRLTNPSPSRLPRMAVKQQKSGLARGLNKGHVSIP